MYRCGTCGQLLCAEHAQFRVICPEHIVQTRFHYVISKIASEDKEEIRTMVRRFWGEEEQLTFERTFKVSELPGYVAKIKGTVIGFISTAEMNNTLLIAALAVLPEYQGLGVGKALVAKTEREGARMKKKRVLVSTSNDDLPALAFYQSIGFQIYDVKPNAIAKKHGKVLSGIGKLPIRDELRLQKKLERKIV